MGEKKKDEVHRRPAERRESLDHPGIDRREAERRDGAERRAAEAPIRQERRSGNDRRESSDQRTGSERRTSGDRRKVPERLNRVAAILLPPVLGPRDPAEGSPIDDVPADFHDERVRESLAKQLGPDGRAV